MYYYQCMPFPIEGGGLTHQVKKEPLERGEIVTNIDLYEGNLYLLKICKICYKSKSLLIKDNIVLYLCF